MLTNKGFIDRLHQVLAENHTWRRFTIGQMAGLMGISERHLQRKVFDLTGHTPTQYLREYRLQMSLNHLRSRQPVGDVANAAGFSSHSYYTSCFKAQYGITPTDFQKRCH